MESFISQYLFISEPLGYILAFLAVMIEGDAPLFVIAFLTYEGYFNLPLVVLFLYLGTVIGDIFWYFLGMYGQRFKFVMNWANRLTAPFEEHFKNHTFKTLLVTKFVYGIHHAIWIRYGTWKLPLKQLFKYDLLLTPLWLLIVGGLGYASGATLLPLGKYVRYTEILLLAGLIILFSFQFFTDKITKFKKVK